MSIVKTTWISHGSVELQNEDGHILRFRTRDGRPRFTVDYKITPEERKDPATALEDKNVTAPFNLEDFQIFLELIGIVVQNQKVEDFPKSATVMCLYHYGKDGKLSEEKLERTKVKFYLDTDNIFKIAITDVMYTENRTTIFKAGYMDWHKMYLGDKEATPEFLSRIHVAKYLKNLNAIIENIVKQSIKINISEREVMTVSAEIASPLKTTAEEANNIESMLNSMTKSI